MAGYELMLSGHSASRNRAGISICYMGFLRGFPGPVSRFSDAEGGGRHDGLEWTLATGLWISVRNCRTV